MSDKDVLRQWAISRIRVLFGQSNEAAMIERTDLQGALSRIDRCSRAISPNHRMIDQTFDRISQWKDRPVETLAARQNPGLKALYHQLAR